MGASVPSDDCIITKTVTSVIILDKVTEKEEPCVRCGSCVLSCPVHLEPVQIMNAVKTLDKERIKALNPLKCIECGKKRRNDLICALREINTHERNGISDTSVMRVEDDEVSNAELIELL